MTLLHFVIFYGTGMLAFWWLKKNRRQIYNEALDDVDNCFQNLKSQKEIFQGCQVERTIGPYWFRSCLEYMDVKKEITDKLREKNQ